MSLHRIQLRRSMAGFNQPDYKWYHWSNHVSNKIVNDTLYYSQYDNRNNTLYKSKYDNDKNNTSMQKRSKSI